MGKVVIPGFRKIEVSGGGEGGTTNYNDLTNKPSINNVSLVGNLNTANLKLTDATLTEEGVPAEAKTVGTKLEEHSTSLTALSEQLGNHTVKSDVPENAVFTDTVYDDTEVKGSIDELNSNLDELRYDDYAGGSNLFDVNKMSLIQVLGNGVKRYGHIIEITESGKYCIYYKSDSVTMAYNYITNEIYGNPVAITSETKKTLDLTSGQKLVVWQGEGNTPSAFELVYVGKDTTDYEPYIPSVKMLAEENAQQSNEIMDIKMLGWSVPSECPIQNYVDSDGVFHQRVGRVDISSIVSNESMFGTSFRLNVPADCKKGTDLNGYCKLYQTSASADYKGWNTYRKNKSIGFLSTYDLIIVKDDAYADKTAFKNAMKGVYLYYELATEITKTIDGNEAISKVNSNLDDYEQRGFLSRNIAKYDISLYKGKVAGVDATLNSDGTISFSGTASSNSFLFYDLDLTGKGIRKVAFNCTN